MSRIATVLSSLIVLQCSFGTALAKELSSAKNANLQKEPELIYLAANDLGVQPTAQNLAISNLTKVTKDYRSAPNEANWSAVTYCLKTALSDEKTYLDLAKIQASVPEFSELGLKLYDAGQARIWTFPQIKDNHEALIEWRQLQTTKNTASKPTKTVTCNVQSLPLPNDIVISEAKVINVAPTSGKEVSAKKVENRYLVLTGNDRLTKALFVMPLKLTSQGWQKAPELFSAVPEGFLSNLTGKVGFVGSDLVVTVVAGNGQNFAGSTSKNGSYTDTAYKLSLRLSGGKYVLEGKGADETVHNVVFQFIRAVQQGKLELAKSWVQDPKLASIPKYIGLVVKTPESQMRLINMPGPSSGAQRFRLITYGKEDLILDVAKVFDSKNKQSQWMIKAIFVAPADPHLQKFARLLPPIDKMDMAETPSRPAATLEDNSRHLSSAPLPANN